MNKFHCAAEYIAVALTQASLCLALDVIRAAKAPSAPAVHFHLLPSARLHVSTKEQKLQDQFLNTIRKERVPVSMFLVNGIKLMGHVESFDQFVVMLRSGGNVQLVYKHAISTVVPSHDVKLDE